MIGKYSRVIAKLPNSKDLRKTPNSTQLSWFVWRNKHKQNQKKSTLVNYSTKRKTKTKENSNNNCVQIKNKFEKKNRCIIMPFGLQVTCYSSIKNIDSLKANNIHLMLIVSVQYAVYLRFFLFIIIANHRFLKERVTKLMPYLIWSVQFMCRSLCSAVNPSISFRSIIQTSKLHTEIVYAKS